MQIQMYGNIGPRSNNTEDNVRNYMHGDNRSMINVLRVVFRYFCCLVGCMYIDDSLISYYSDLMM